MQASKLPSRERVLELASSDLPVWHNKDVSHDGLNAVSLLLNTHSTQSEAGMCEGRHGKKVGGLPLRGRVSLIDGSRLFKRLETIGRGRRLPEVAEFIPRAFHQHMGLFNVLWVSRSKISVVCVFL